MTTDNLLTAADQKNIIMVFQCLEQSPKVS